MEGSTEFRLDCLADCPDCADCPLPLADDFAALIAQAGIEEPQDGDVKNEIDDEDDDDGVVTYRV